jgi:sulfite exporter TauE/SafE
MAQTALIGALLAGLLGGLHCIAMCGGYIAAVSRSPAGGLPLLPTNRLWALQLAAQAGRVTTYVALGTIFGAAGGAAIAASWEPLQRVLYVVANLLLLALAFAVARGEAGSPLLERAGLAVFARVLPAVAPLARSSGIAGRFGLGLLWGLTPCALVYGVLPVAMLAGGAADGALVMLAFGLGTLPNLLAAGWLVARAPSWMGGRRARLAAAGLIAAFALAGIWRALFVSSALAHGPFCIVP